MLDRRFIRENPTVVQDAINAKGIDLDLDELLRLDRLTRTLQREVDETQAQRKAFSKKFARADDAERERLRQDHQDFDAHLHDLRDRLADAAAQLERLLLLTPAIPWSGAPIGDDESANVQSASGTGAAVRLDPGEQQRPVAAAIHRPTPRVIHSDVLAAMRGEAGATVVDVGHLMPFEPVFKRGSSVLASARLGGASSGSFSSPAKKSATTSAMSRP